MSLISVVLVVVIWLYLLSVLKRANLKYWHFLLGCLGLFVMMMVWLQPFLTQPLARLVAAIVGLPGELTHTYLPFFKYGILYVYTNTGSITMQIDLECSGIIEMMAFISLLVFFDVYNRSEKALVGLLGLMYLLFCNALRVTVICLSVHWFGVEAYYIFHTFVGRILFYGLSILLYYYVFTKPHIVRMKVGKITYVHNENNS